ncbi:MULTISPECIES: 2TM domain-containing protein [Tenacibaculum]|uniref:2TM domain-containing protein n=1 Tax=Tenacibaculum TaxID=104267 RepID=UPI000897CDE7|nr:MULTISPECIES: 2TM domain-containing protein [unclassified Tenacibaculum]RBW63205.1 histidine kinase [Tenacibaculum sp. E3R01]SEE44544.1 2TM domain-containing protein [Tenacibaculum sp. MAR_2010_89]
MDTNYTQEKKYIEAKKKIKKVKAFYIHVVVNIVSIVIIVSVNLTFVPYFHWFWFPVMGIILVTFIHWMIVFGSDVIGYGKDWEERKIDEYIKKNK